MDQHTTEIAEGITRVANLRMQVIEKLMDHITLAVPNPNYEWYVEIPNPSNRRTYSFPVKVAYGLWKGESATERQTHEGVKFFRDLDFVIKQQ